MTYGRKYKISALARIVDPLAPRPEGSMICPARGDHASVSTSLPRSIDSALHKYGTSQSRVVAAVVLDHSARPAYSLTYGKCSLVKLATIELFWTIS